MSFNLTNEQIIAMAPDIASAAAGRKQANMRFWSELGRNDHAVWGACKGSAKDPYRVGVDLAGPAFRCSCPSRKFPCKHALGLMLLLIDQTGSLPETAPPEWIGEWLTNRARSAERREQREQAAQSAPVEDVPATVEGAERTRSAREESVADGMSELALWLNDQIRGGLATLQANSPGAFSALAARMVDAKAPGAARWLRVAAALTASGEGWQKRVLDRLARLHLLARAYQQRDTLPPDVRADVETAIGFSVRQEDVLQLEGTIDRWTVVGRRVEAEDHLQVQRTWLWGERCAAPALLLDFAAPGKKLDQSLVPGLRFEADLVWYPSTMPLRALIRERRRLIDDLPNMPAHSITQACRTYAAALGRNPWLERHMLSIGPASLVFHDERWYLQDAEHRMLPLLPQFTAGWRVLALSGGHPFLLFAEWDGEYLTPLSAEIGGRLYSFGAA